jgi:hypothetical protein
MGFVAFAALMDKYLAIADAIQASFNEMECALCRSRHRRRIALRWARHAYRIRNRAPIAVCRGRRNFASGKRAGPACRTANKSYREVRRSAAARRTVTSPSSIKRRAPQFATFQDRSEESGSMYLTQCQCVRYILPEESLSTNACQGRNTNELV